jgi:Arc/MetJ family transcription regulator
VGVTTRSLAPGYGVSEWTLTGTLIDGRRLEVNGCDFLTVHRGKIIKKDSYRKEDGMSRTRTNIELDDDIVEAAMRLYGTRSKKETVDLALRRLVGARLGTEEALALEGSGWEGDLDQMRDDAPPDSA